MGTDLIHAFTSVLENEFLEPVGTQACDAIVKETFVGVDPLERRHPAPAGDTGPGDRVVDGAGYLFHFGPP